MAKQARTAFLYGPTVWKVADHQESNPPPLAPKGLHWPPAPRDPTLFLILFMDQSQWKVYLFTILNSHWSWSYPCSIKAAEILPKRVRFWLVFMWFLRHFWSHFFPVIAILISSFLFLINFWQMVPPRRTNRTFARQFRAPSSTSIPLEPALTFDMYSLMQWNWFSESPDALELDAFSDVREPISLHLSVLPPGFL